ncbi:transcription-repair coupling factor, partial [Acidobacteria bacterium AH-259-G07]|nr:transcription-repair coupling factor [Acidobacteria bacterium AH-259-G07]
EGLHRADSALVLAALFRESPGPFLWLCLNNREAEKIAENLRFFLPKGSEDHVLIIPGSETDPYRGLSPHPKIAAERAIGLWRLLKGFQGFIVTTGASMAARMPSPADFLSNCIHLEVGGFLPLDHLLERLREIGYVREDPVSELGEYSRRGGIVDVFSPAHGNPVRIEFFGDEIESIREFDPSTQSSTELIPSCEVVPMREMILTECEIARWHEKAPEHWREVRFAEALQEKLQFTENRELFNGFEYLFPLVVKSDHHLLEFLPKGQDSRIVIGNADEFLGEFECLHVNQQKTFQERDASGELVLPPERLFFSKQWLVNLLEEQDVFYVEQLSNQPQEARHFDFQIEQRYRGRIQNILTDLNKWRKAQERVVLVMGSRGMAERLVHIFKEYEVGVYLAEKGIDEALFHPLSVTQGKLSEGFYSPSLRLHVLTQENVFEESQLKPPARKPAHRDIAGKFVSDFRDLKEGDYVVHVDHGIGVFGGLKRIGVGKEVREFVVLTYRDAAKLYVPVHRLDRIQKYSGSGGAAPQIDRLGGASWEKTKRRIKKSMRHLAEDLLKLYARRETAKGHAFSPDDFLSREFDEAFEFEETPDQVAAIRDVKCDMEAERPMDRLICGDVGYGKTEVAMRAAFKAVNDSKQVAILAPTTVLALQHYNTFRERFQAFPISIKMLSRFQSRRDQADILRRTSLGLEDVLIGTHRLLSKDVHFQNLGLIIVDEEQRFGVSQKERLKQLKTEVDVMALSATPIPRTLNMSLIGVRDLSIIETPPQDRLAIQTVVVKFNRNIIRSAIDLELKREGQIFFVHNSVETIYSIARMVQEIVPEARVAVAHGQMRERQLEQVMLHYVNYRYDVLVSTTIIENGLDIPRANTLIVNRADRFGLGQLYQLRGRVGRSNRRAYAYFMIPSQETLSQDARQRLAAIKEFSELGAGFRLAALDLEIRGAGNLLGSEQHGHISAVGFELYMKLLERAIRKLKGEEIREDVQTNIDLRLDIQIPEHYIDDSNQRLWLYKRVSSAPDELALNNLKEEIEDRFGKYPNSVSNLFEYAKLRLRTQHLRILSVERKGSKVFLKFREDTPVSRRHIIDLVARNGHFSVSPEGIMAAEISSPLPPEVFEDVHTLLDEITVLE